MPKNVMRENQFRALEALTDNPVWKAELNGKNAREYYRGLGDEKKNIISFLVHFAAFVTDEDLMNPDYLEAIMENDAARKGGESGLRLLEISRHVVGATRILQDEGIVGRYAYVPQAGGEIPYGFDAGGGDHVFEDLRGRRGFKAMQSGTTPRNVAKKEVELVDFYGEFMKGKNRVVGLFSATNEQGIIRGEEELAKIIADGLSTTRIVVAT